jgi:hypothetical protein
VAFDSFLFAWYDQPRRIRMLLHHALDKRLQIVFIELF